MINVFLTHLKIISGVKIAEAELADDRHRAIFHTAEQVDQIMVEVIEYLKVVYCRLAEQYAARTAEHIYKPAVFQRKQIIDDM